MGLVSKLRHAASERRATWHEAVGVGPVEGAPTVTAQLIAECVAMSSFAMRSGLRVPPRVVEDIAMAESVMKNPAGTTEAVVRSHIRYLVQAHDQLVHIVAPATPGALMLFEHERATGKASALGPVQLVRQMVMVTAFLLVVFLVSALSPDVKASSGDIFNSSGMSLAINELFLLSAAGIGAAFAALFKANRYIADGTYDSKYESSYWVRFVLGLLAGIVLASLIPIKSGGSGGGLSKPFLALLGGFSASVVFQILTQVVGTLESLVSGDEHAEAAANVKSANAQAVTARTQDQMRLSAGLVKLREQLGAGVEPAKLSSTLNRMLGELMPLEPDEEEEGATAPASGPAPSDTSPTDGSPPDDSAGPGPGKEAQPSVVTGAAAT